MTFVVFDASRFAGPAVARSLARRGHRLVLHAAEPALIAEIEESGADYLDVPNHEVPLRGAGSIATPEGSSTLLARCLDRFGSIDGALIRAGNFVDGGLPDIDESGFEALVDNLRISTWALRTFSSEFAARGSGALLMCTSAHPLRPVPALGLYAAVRAAENSLVRSTALAVAAQGVSVNAVATNFMRFPEFRGGWRDSFETDFASEIPTTHFGSMSELAEFCLPILEGRARHLTGQVISWSGGWA